MTSLYIRVMRGQLVAAAICTIQMSRSSHPEPYHTEELPLKGYSHNATAANTLAKSIQP